MAPSPMIARTALALLCASGSFVAGATDRSTWQAEAAIKGVDAECKPYDYPPVSAIVSATLPVLLVSRGFC